MSNPLDEFLSEYGETEKVASPLHEVADRFGKGLAGGVGAAAATMAIGGVGMAASKIYDAATKTHDFRQMLAYNPDLHEHRDRDPRMFNQYFTSLRAMNPGFSKDPIVAGTYMRRMVENPLTAGGMLTEAVGSRDKFPSLFNRATEEGIGAGISHFKKVPQAGGRDGAQAPRPSGRGDSPGYPPGDA